MGKPALDLDEYNIINVDGITVYVRNDVQAHDDEIRIKYAKILFKESLIVEGIAV